MYSVLDDVLSVFAEEIQDLFNVGFIRKTTKPDAILESAGGDDLQRWRQVRDYSDKATALRQQSLKKDRLPEKSKCRCLLGEAEDFFLRASEVIHS